ncbi:MFS transporter [Sinanaerobacter chloroacetimidivorans]|uniref:MFS transporter n=1 Tax=Sinanaerobacter chloroacetimidivorans TaxID=2818044 RepID=A0A8J7VYJ5_9FIRM|nr:MFS transporter [Sinanaerobacter chloroacetimidivorans]MBR0597447.1 MFS transporter [Sinanaerobacter chloroacetimidivorans]
MSKQQTLERKPVTLGVKFGYGIASAGDAIVFAIMTVFLMLFLTTVAGLEPGTAGTVSSVALFSSAVATLFIGYFSDNSKSKTGRRRPFVKVAIPFMFIAFVMLYSSFGLTGTTAVLYYGFFAILFWISYCAFFVPYTALGAEITGDYGERTSLRSYAAVFTQAGNLTGGALPLLLVGALIASGQTESMSWTMTAAVFAGASAIFIGSMVAVTKGRELIIDRSKETEKPNLFKDYFMVLKSKPMIWLILSIIGFNIVNAIFAANLPFFVIFKLGMSDAYVPVIISIMFIAAIPMAPVINYIAQKLDKRKAYIFLFCLSAALMLILRLMGVNSYPMMIALTIALVVSNAAYWQLIAAIIYDVAEVIELKTGKRAEGTLASLQSITQQIGSAIAVFLMGWFLQFNGFNAMAETQTDQAIGALITVQTVIPSILLFISAAMMLIFPITKNKFELVQKALTQKDETGNYDKTGLERIL